MDDLIAGRTLAEWRDFARTDYCLDQMVPSDLRALLARLEDAEAKLAQWDAQDAAWAERVRLLTDRIEAAEAKLARMEAALRDQTEARVEAVIRRNFTAPEDGAVEAMCLRFGYGAVMDAASRLWARRDMLGAFYIGGCIGFRTEEEARAALQREG